MEKEPITIQGLEKLKEELIFLKEKKRPEIVVTWPNAKVVCFFGIQSLCNV